jgi:diguanylate cyclase (GGDEF)-like protein/PAS domain S-box-containing protein
VTSLHSRYRRLAHIAKDIHASMHLPELLRNVVVAVSEEIVTCDAVGYYEAQPDGTFRGSVSKPDVLGGTTIDRLIVDPRRDALAQQLIATRKSVYIADTDQSPLPDQDPVNRFQIRSVLGVPVYFDREIFGLLFVFNVGVPLVLSEEEIAVIESYVLMAAVAIRNTKLFENTQLLLDASRALSVCTSTKQVVTTCFGFLERALDNPNAAIHLADGRGGFIPLALDGNSSWTQERWQGVHREVAVKFETDQVFQHVLRTKQPLLIPDVSQDDRPSREACERFGIRGLLMLPLMAEGQVIGIIGIPSLDGPRTYADGQMRMAEALASTTAATLANVWRAEELEARVRSRTEELEETNRKLRTVVEQLETLAMEHAVILDAAADGIYGVDARGRILFANPAAIQMVGAHRADVLGQAEEAVFARARESVQAVIGSESAGDNEACDVMTRADGSRFIVHATQKRVQESSTQLERVVTFRDITESATLQVQIRTQATTDELTGLPNRAHFLAYLSHELEQAKALSGDVALMFIDLDRFKEINDTLGHSSGDVLLQEAATRLRRALAFAGFAARLGGDEFVVVLSGAGVIAAAIRTANAIMEYFSQPIDVRGFRFFISPSIGISIASQDGADVETLLKHADMAMYARKAAGGGGYDFYSVSMQMELNRRLQLERHLYETLHRHEFTLMYQPQINLRTGVMEGVEALLRWEHGTLGAVSPAEFIPVAENMGLIGAIGDWVLREACRQLALWDTLGVSLCLAVNVSARQLVDEQFPDRLREVLNESGVAPERIEIELTEGAVFHTTWNVLSVLRRTRSLGVRIAIDDFGKGYSSLSYLKDFPLDTLKVDRGFVSGLCDDPRNQAITAAIVALANHVGLRAIAEGVETRDQLSHLLRQNCQMAQGYYFSRPVTPDEVPRLTQCNFMPWAEEGR